MAKKKKNLNLDSFKLENDLNKTVINYIGNKR